MNQEIDQLEDKKNTSPKHPAFSFRRIASRELYQPSQEVEPEGPRVYYRSRRHHLTRWPN